MDVSRLDRKDKIILGSAAAIGATLLAASAIAIFQRKAAHWGWRAASLLGTGTLLSDLGWCRWRLRAEASGEARGHKRSKKLPAERMRANLVKALQEHDLKPEEFMTLIDRKGAPANDYTCKGYNAYDNARAPISRQEIFEMEKRGRLIALFDGNVDSDFTSDACSEFCVQHVRDSFVKALEEHADDFPAVMELTLRRLEKDWESELKQLSKQGESLNTLKRAGATACLVWLPHKQPYSVVGTLGNGEAYLLRDVEPPSP